MSSRSLALAGFVVSAALAGCGGASKPRPDLLFVSSRAGAYAIYAMNADGSRQQRLSKRVPSQVSSAKELLFEEDPAWSPDGRSIVFTSNRTGASELYTMLADGSGVRRLTAVSGGAARPAWSPDGTHIAFVENDPGDLYVMRSYGTDVHRLGSDLANETDPAWSPDGRLIAFARRTPGTPVVELWTVRRDSSGRRQITRLNAAVSSPSWSPDGRRLAFAASRAGRFEIYVVGVDERGVERLTTTSSADIEPAWSPDGKVIAFSRDGAIDTVDLAGNVRLLTDTKNNDSSPAWKPGAKSFTGAK